LRGRFKISDDERFVLPVIVQLTEIVVAIVAVDTKLHVALLAHVAGHLFQAFAALHESLPVAYH
jgi:hypothetical protein